MSYAHKLEYAGSDPYEPEEARDDITHEEYELLTQDETYQRLAEVRWLAGALDIEIANADEIPEEARDAVFAAVGAGNAPLQRAVDAYVDHWLKAHREEVSD